MVTTPSDPEEIVMPDGVPPADVDAEPRITFSRNLAELFALMDLTPTGWRVLWALIAAHDADTGVVKLSQNELVVRLGAGKATVNRGIGELEETGLIVASGYGTYTLHPELVGGATPGPVALAREIRAKDPESFSEARRERYRLQAQNLRHAVNV